MANGESDFAIAAVIDFPHEGAVKEIECLFVLCAFRTSHAFPCHPAGGVTVAFIATEHVEAHPVIARQAPQMVKARQGFALFPTVVGLGFDPKGIGQLALRGLLTTLSQLRPHHRQASPQPTGR